jgi:hypothetical protein
MESGNEMADFELATCPYLIPLYSSVTVKFYFVSRQQLSHRQLGTINHGTCMYASDAR